MCSCSCCCCCNFARRPPRAAGAGADSEIESHPILLPPRRRCHRPHPHRPKKPRDASFDWKTGPCSNVLHRCYRCYSCLGAWALPPGYCCSRPHSPSHLRRSPTRTPRPPGVRLLAWLVVRLAWRHGGRRPLRGVVESDGGVAGGGRDGWVCTSRAKNPPAQLSTLSLTCSFSKSYTRRRPFSLMVSWSIGLLGVCWGWMMMGGRGEAGTCGRRKGLFAAVRPGSTGSLGQRAPSLAL